MVYLLLSRWFNVARELVEKPRNKRQKIAFDKDKIVEQRIKEHPGLNSVELEKIMKDHHGFKRSYLKNALARLERKKRIVSKYRFSKGKNIKLYLRSKDPVEEPGIITIPRKLLRNPNEWKQDAFAYIERCNEIKISPIKLDKLEMMSLIKEPTFAKLNKNTLTITLPARLVNFLELGIDNYDVSVDSNTIKIKIMPKMDKSPERIDGIKTILVLEDDDYWAREFEVGLSKNGYEVYVARNMKEAAKIMSSDIDYYILDDKIDSKNEAENYFVKLIKEKKEIKGCTFITSEQINKDTYARLTELGFSSIIFKHRYDNEQKNVGEILKEQIKRLKMFSN